MGYVEHRQGALAVVRQAHDKNEIQRLVRQYDDRLFIEQQIGFDQKPVWCVVVNVDPAPITLLEWRDRDTGEPINELTSGLVERVARMERDGKRLADRVILANKQLVEGKRREIQAAYRDIIEDMEPRMSGTRSAVLHRGQYLRRSRDKQRAQGDKV